MGRRGVRAQQLSRRERKNPKPIPLCAYCGERPGVEEEHVVASCFFNDNSADEITVPACADCNRKRGDGGPRDLSLDEEYVRNIFCLQDDMGDHPVANTLMKGAVMRSFANSPPLARRLLGTTKWVTPVTEQGIILPPQASFTVELERIVRVTRKIVRGLYYFKEKTPLPQEIHIEVAPRLIWDLMPEYLTRFSDAPDAWQGFKNRVCVWKAARTGPTPPDCYRTMWLFVWYNRYAVMAATGPKSDLLIPPPQPSSVILSPQSAASSATPADRPSVRVAAHASSLAL